MREKQSNALLFCARKFNLNNIYIYFGKSSDIDCCLRHTDTICTNVTDFSKFTLLLSLALRSFSILIAGNVPNINNKRLDNCVMVAYKTHYVPSHHHHNFRVWITALCLGIFVGKLMGNSCKL